MIARVNPILEELENLCEHGVLDSFAEFLAQRQIPSDAQLAELIDVDARALIANGRPVDMSRYLHAVPDLERMPISLDAAIEFTLRSSSGSPQPNPEAVSRLERMYPRFARSIRNAAALSEGLATTRGLCELGSSRRTQRALPSDFGPRLSDGIARYSLVQHLGEGSQGDVYLAVDRALSDDAHAAMVAIKLLAGGKRLQADRWRAMDEATRARRVNHPNVVGVLDRGECDGQDYIVYEHVAGGDLEAWRKGQDRISARHAATLIAQIARGVQAAHAAGLVHRDLKPANILMAGPDAAGAFQPKVTDFGVAASTGPRLDPLPDEERVGNLAFIAPEQYRNQESGWTAPVDVYALGGMLFYLLTGGLPNGRTAGEVAATHDPESGRTSAPMLIGSGKDCDSDLAAICRKALSPRIEDRYQTAESLASDLDRWLALEPIPSFHPGPARRAALLIRRRPGMVATVALACIAVLLSTALAVTWKLKAVTAASWAKAEQTQKDLATSVFHNATEALSSTKHVDVPGDWFPALTVLESMTGPYLFDPRTAGREPWSRKMLLAAESIKASKKSGCENSIETLLWSDVLSFWLLRSGEYERAETLLQKLDPRCDSLLSPDDPWKLKRATLHHVAAAQQLLARFAADPGFTPDPVSSTQLVDCLRADERRCADDHFGDSMHRFVIAHLVKLYDKPALNRQSDLAWATRRVQEIRDSFVEQSLPPTPLEQQAR